MAWVEKLPSGRYRAVYRDVDGKRKSLGVFTHKRAAQDAGGDKEAELRRGVGKRPEMTWGTASSTTACCEVSVGTGPA